MIKRTLLALLAAVSIQSSSYAQQSQQGLVLPVRTCGTEIPGAEWDRWFNERVEAYKAERAAGKVQVSTITIPVVVHVIHGGQAVGTHPNLSQAQVNSQIPVLNNDFAGTGYNVGNLAATAFSAVGAMNCDVVFCPAEKDPNGNTLTEPGIDRRNWSIEGWTNPASQTTYNGFMNLMNNTIKPASIWDATRYLNIWVSDVNTGLGLLGYATFPPSSGLAGLSGVGTTGNDGVWIWSRSYGNLGSSFSPYNRGRTATHEIGHWLGLRHINGDAACGNDYCADTPLQQALNFGCPTYPKISCSNGPNGEMFMNFMDYCDDPCLYMFTPNQNTRIQTALANSPLRNQLNASSASLCNVPAVAPVAAFTIETTICRDSLIKPFNQSTGSPAPSYIWALTPSNGVIISPSASVANPTITFAFPGFYTLSLVATNSLSNSTYTEMLLVLDCGNTVGLSELFAGQHLALYPNPAKDRLQLRAGFLQDNEYNIELMNQLGQVLFSVKQKAQATGELELELPVLPDGLYELRVSSGKLGLHGRLLIGE